MDYFLIIIPTIIALIVILIIKLKKNTDSFNKNVAESETSTEFKENRIIIPIEQLLSTTEIDENKLCEITDDVIIARISRAIPSVPGIIAKTITNNELRKVDLYRVIIPSGETLVRSNEVEGAVRGFSRGAKRIIKQANLMKVNPTKISKASVMANGVENVMNVGSLIVGQYYMSKINSRIEAMSENVSKISDFQDREFKSRILSLIVRVGEISSFSAEILESDTLRNRKLQTLEDSKGEGTQLLQQVNLSIDEIIKENQKADYKVYQTKVNDFGVLLEHQQIIMSVLEEISKLTYLLGKGEISNEMSYSIFNMYLKQSNHIRTALKEWHEKQVEVLGIDIDKNRINKTGIERVVATIPGLVDDNWYYKELESGFGQKINAQKIENRLIPNQPENVYDNDVQIIIKNGKLYYLSEM